MATAEKTQPEAEAKAKINKYVVCGDAVVVTVGKKANGRPEYNRVLRGGVINGPASSETIKDLLRRGAIKGPVKSREELAEMQADLADPQRSKHRLTVREAARRSGAEDDPVAAPNEGVLPVPAPNPTVSPDAILAEDVAE